MRELKETTIRMYKIKTKKIKQERSSGIIR